MQAGQNVGRGDVLFVLDPWVKRSELKARQVELRLAEAQHARLTATHSRTERIPQEKVVEASEWAWKAAADRLQRTVNMGRAAALRGTVQTARGVPDRPRPASKKARADLGLLNAGPSDEEKAIAEAKVAQARVAVSQVEEEIAHRTVRAPGSGQVLQVNVRVGEAVGSLSGPPLVTMATD